MTWLQSNASHLMDGTTFKHLYGVLNLLVDLCEVQMAVLSSKLVSAGFVTATIDVKAMARYWSMKGMLAWKVTFVVYYMNIQQT